MLLGSSCCLELVPNCPHYRFLEMLYDCISIIVFANIPMDIGWVGICNMSRCYISIAKNPPFLTERNPKSYSLVVVKGSVLRLLLTLSVE